MRVAVAIAHAAFDPARRRGVERICDTLKGVDVHVSKSMEREPAWVWARRLWTWTADQEADRVVLLNDDVDVCPELVPAVEAMQPPHMVSLHTSVPMSRSLAEAGIPWALSYWLTGPGYVLSPAMAANLLKWWASLPMPWGQHINEDNAAISWAAHHRRPIPQAIPALVRHDTSYPSMLGYDDHPMRTTPVPWDQYPGARITDPEHWRSHEGLAAAPLLENPWATSHACELADRAIRAGIPPEACWFCTKRRAARGSTITGARICGVCLAQTLSSILVPQAAPR